MGLDAVMASAVGYGYGVDWLRVKGLFHQVGYSHLDEHVIPFVRKWALGDAIGNSMKPWRLNGYSGWSLGRFSFGTRGHEIMLEYRSDLAQEGMRMVSGLGLTATRIDIKRDFALAEEDDAFAYLVWDRVRKVKAAGGKYAPKKDPICRQCDAGWSMDTNNREAERFLRSYNKSSEQGWSVSDGCPMIWRVELEMKKRLAAEVFEFLQEKGWGDEVLAGVLRFQLRNMGLSCLSEVSPVVPPRRIRIEYLRDDERSLAWLERSVRRTVGRLLDKGKIDATLKAIGLVDGI